MQEVSNRPLLETLLAYLREQIAAADARQLRARHCGGCDGCPCPVGRLSDLRILATSREPLRSAGEHTSAPVALSFPSLEAAIQIRATDATTYAAILLFTDRAKAVDHQFTLNDENAPIVAEICRRLDGIPLAIELAAAQVNSMPVKALVRSSTIAFEFSPAAGARPSPSADDARDDRLELRFALGAGTAAVRASLGFCRRLHAGRRESGLRGKDVATDDIIRSQSHRWWTSRW